MRSYLALLVMLGGRAYGAERAEPSGAGDTEALKGNVLVWLDATLYTEPSDTAPSLHAASLHGARKDSAGDVVPMHVVAVTKGFVEVEPAAEVDCAWSRLTTSDDVAKLHLFVKRGELAPVLVAPFTKTFDNGSRIALRPGVPVVPTSDGKFVLGVRGGELVVELPATAVGHAYTPDKIKPVTAIADREYELAPKTSVALGDQALVLANQRATTIDRRGASTVFSIETRCMALDVVAPTKSVRVVDDESASIDMGGGSGVLELRDHDYIAPGTPLSTPGGRMIAAAAKPIYLVAAPHGKTACIERHVHVDMTGAEALAPTNGDDRLRVCAPVGRVIHERVRSAMSANGTTGR